MSTDILKNTGLVRTNCYCHACEKNFVARLDYDIDGNHEIHCPCCNHIHYRKIKGGVVTDDRFDSDANTTVVPRGRCRWIASDIPAITDTAQMFIRERWLDKYRA